MERRRVQFRVEDMERNPIPPLVRAQLSPDPEVVRRDGRRVREREPPIFRSDPKEDSVDWLFRFEEISSYNQWTPQQQLSNFGMFLEGIARRWYLSLAPRPTTFAEIRDRFLLAFKPPNYDLDLEAKLRSRVQGENEQAISYCHDVIYLCSCVNPQMSEGTKLQHLLRGLKGSLVKKVYPFLKSDEHNVQDFMRLVQIQCQAVLLAEQSTAEISTGTPLMTLQTHLAPPSSPFVTKEELQQFKKDLTYELRGELNSTLKDLKKEVSSDLKEIGRELSLQVRDMFDRQESRNKSPTYKRTVDGQPIRFGCNKSGHINRDCPDLNERPIRKCFICGSPSHLANRCSQPREKRTPLSPKPTASSN